MHTHTIQISQEAIKHIKFNDPLMGHFIENVGTIKREIIEDPFSALIQSIVFQQLAFSAANTIWNRLLANCNNLTPINILNLSDDAIRECGLSRSKVQYSKNIAKAFLDGTISNEKLTSSLNQDIINMLVKIKGIGTWTAEMFLIFCLCRQDIFSYKDLGLRKGVKWLYSLDGEPTERFCIALQERWKPYQSIVSLYLWEVTIQNYFNTKANDLFYPFLKEETMQIGYYKSPIGQIKITVSDKGLEELSFADDSKYIKNNSNSTLVNKTIKQLDEYFLGTRKVFDIPLYYDGTPFQKNVWQALNTIAYGDTKTYGEIAEIVGNKKASRAVGGANNKNKIAIIVPCHRVIGANGQLTGYAGGLDKKKWLLEHEKSNV